MLLPFPETTIFRWERQQCVLGTRWFLLDLLCGYATLAAYHQLPVAKWFVVLPLSLLAWAQILALSALCIAWFPRFPYQLITGLAILFGVVVFFAHELVGPALLNFLDHSAPYLNQLLPTGWPVVLFQIMLPGGDWLWISLLLPIGAVFVSLKHAFSRLQANYELHEPVWAEAPDLVPDITAANAIPGTATPDQPLRVGPTAIEHIVQSRAFLESPAWHHLGWFENLLWRWLNPRERILAEFVFPLGFIIGARWKTIFRYFGVTSLLAITSAFFIPGGAFWVLGCGLVLTGGHVLAQIFTTGSAFQPVRCGGVNIPLYAGYAIGFRELGGLLFKCSLVQFPLVILVAVAASVLGFYLAALSLAAGALFGLKAGGLLLMSRFLLITFGFSSGTNDTSPLRFRSLILLLAIIPFCVAFVALGAASLFAPSQPLAWLLLACAALVAYTFYRIYGWFYHTNHFDLMNQPQR